MLDRPETVVGGMGAVDVDVDVEVEAEVDVDVGGQHSAPPLAVGR